MKDPKHNSWKNRLTEHLPDENVWGRILDNKPLDQQVSNLKNQLPIYLPKENTWAGIQKSLKRKKRVVALYRLSAAAIFLLGFWGMIWLTNSDNNFEEEFLMTDISNTTITKPIPTQVKPQEVRKIESVTTTKKEVSPSEEFIQIIGKEEIMEAIEIDIPLPELFVAEIHEDEIDTELDTTKDFKGSKKIIIVDWEEPSRRIKIDGFNVELTEKELQAIQDLNSKKKGGLRLQINELTARLYEQ
ncbi:hypothetical protein MM213_11005 [Belliella sp. R4-6]|uniref:Uncharacterized protein n=1 Tax=Belliella alkalica TaxID=1730871 RepID=A0ABS9VC46_9BACT|nr:hypothetical protein [Belliella alkalica]MCH7414018.1 hypothetical protein [Belliella alkalica]